MKYLKLAYLIIPNGNVISFYKNRIRVMKGSVDKDGYIYFKLKYKSGYKHSFQHRLVATMYINNPENKKTVNHKNGIKNDNNISNLEWATHSENELHSYRILGKKPVKSMLGKSGKEIHNSKSVLCIDTNEIFESASLAGKHYGLSGHSPIARACRTNRKSCDMNWRYL